MTEVIDVLKRRKNKEGVTKKRKTEGSRRMKKGRKKERKYFVCSVKEIRRTVSSPTGIEPGSSLIQGWIVIVLLTKPLIRLYKNYRILNWIKYSHVH